MSRPFSAPVVGPGRTGWDEAELRRKIPEPSSPGRRRDRRRAAASAPAWARSRGLDVIATDRRVTNLLASRFWPVHGFRTTFLRLYRHIP